MLDFKALLCTKSWLKDTNGDKVRWNKIKELKFHGDQPDIIDFKYNFEETCRKLNCCIIRNITRKSKKMDQEITVQILYRGPIPVPEGKYKDLINLCATMIIPKKYHDFYKNLKHTNEVLIDGGED